MIVCFFPSPGHLHAGNVVVVGGKTCCLLDIENWMLGVPSYYRQFYTQFKKIMVSCPDTSRQSNWLEHLFRERNRLWYSLGKDDADNAVCGFCLFSGEAVVMSNAWTSKRTGIFWSRDPFQFDTVTCLYCYPFILVLLLFTLFFSCHRGIKNDMMAGAFFSVRY